MTGIFDLNSIKTALDKTSEQCDIDGCIIKRVYLGTVFGLSPSGKYHTTFANSNVTEEEIAMDDEWYERAELELDHIGAYLESGETDPCNLFAEIFVREANK